MKTKKVYSLTCLQLNKKSNQFDYPDITIFDNLKSCLLDIKQRIEINKGYQVQRNMYLNISKLTSCIILRCYEYKTIGSGINNTKVEMTLRYIIKEYNLINHIN